MIKVFNDVGVHVGTKSRKKWILKSKKLKKYNRVHKDYGFEIRNDEGKLY